MFDLYNEAETPAGTPFDGRPAPQGWLATTGRAVMRGGVKAAKGAALAGSVLAPSEGDAGPDPGRVLPRKEDFFRFIDERLEPAEQFWADRGELSAGKKFVSGIMELPLQLVGGVPGIAMATTGNTGVSLINQGVDTETAAGVAALTGAGVTAMSALPQAGATIKQTLALALANPVTGAAQDATTRQILRARGYEGAGAQFDPFDIPARSVDLTLGLVFGGMAHYGKWRQTAPQQVLDAIDIVERAKQQQALNPFQPASTAAKAHDPAMAKALADLDNNQPVDVGQQMSQVPNRYTAEKLHADLRQMYSLPAEQADAVLFLAARRAAVKGQSLDAWVGENIAGMEQGTDSAYSPLFQDSQPREVVPPFHSRLLAEVGRLPQEKWQAADLAAKLQKTPGIKADELAWTGLDEFLAGKKSVTREEVRQYLEQNQVQVQEIVKGENIHDPALYGDYQLPGGKFYRELLLTLPDTEQTFDRLGKYYRSNHFEEPNILAHVRYAEHETAAGQKVLHLEEVQSDWHQARRDGKSVPNAPFAKTWHELALKRMLRHAAEKGFDRVTWTTGEQQAARYDLSKKLDLIDYAQSGDQWHLVGVRDGKRVIDQMIADRDLPDAVGKDMATKMRNGVGEPSADTQRKVMKGLELKIGGEGMSGFYDRMLPQFLAKLAKRFGGEMQDTALANGETVHSITIPEAWRDTMLHEGQPLFQYDGTEKGAVSFQKDGRAVIHALEAPDFSTAVHELAHIIEADLSKAERAQFDTWLHSQVPGTKWNRDQRELFARAFERYLIEGNAPPEVAGVFAKIRQFMLDVYRAIAGSAIDVKMNPQVRQAFDAILFADQFRTPKNDAHLREIAPTVKATIEEFNADIRDTYGDMAAGFDELPAPLPAGDVDAASASRQLSPLYPAEPSTIAERFGRDPANVPPVLRELLEGEARDLETATHDKVAIDGYQKSATVSTAAPWWLELNRMLREQGGNGMGKKEAINALRKSAKGEFDKLTPGQQQVVSEAIDHIDRTTQAMTREIDGVDLQPGDRFTSAHLEQRTVAAERNGRLILDNGETIPMAQPLRIIGEVDQSGRFADQPLNAADLILKEQGDFDLEVGTMEGQPVRRSATEWLNEARDEIAVAEQQQHLYHRAAVCMGLG